MEVLGKFKHFRFLFLIIASQRSGIFSRKIKALRLSKPEINIYEMLAQGFDRDPGVVNFLLVPRQGLMNASFYLESFKEFRKKFRKEF
jgi:hypothetical protein